MMVVLVVVACVVRTVSGEAGSGQGEGGEDPHEDFLVVRFITSSLSALVGLTHSKAAVRELSDTATRKIFLSIVVVVAITSSQGADRILI